MNKINLDSIGFYTLSNKRAETANASTPISRAEILVTDRCNFKCPYCRGMQHKGDVPWRDLVGWLNLLRDHKTRNYRFSGGEPTLYGGIIGAIMKAKDGGAERIAISTNGSAEEYFYGKMIDAGADDFSVSLDACCQESCDKMSGGRGNITRISESIKYLSSRAYTTVGIVYTKDNESELKSIVEFALGLGVHDVRIIPAAQYSNVLSFDGDGVTSPILNYRIGNIRNKLPVRGLSPSDSIRCPLVLDDVAISGGYHYPCIIYLREGGEPIGRVCSGMRTDRENWFKSHDCHSDGICSRNCLDVCVAYNNAWIDARRRAGGK